MKTLYLCLIFLLFKSSVSLAQVYTPLSDNLSVSSYSNIKIVANLYNIQDVGLDGLIQINNASHVVIDGDSVEANGMNYSGYLVKIDHSDHIIIKNFTSVHHFKYAVYITNSNHVEIIANNFSHNKVDSSGFIDVWTNYTAALGGGVMCYNCDSIRVHGNMMRFQNDGVALYHSRKIEIDSNDFSWNTSYGVRMFWTDSSYIHYNNCAHINRPLTDPSDCAALLMIVSNENRVVNNNLTYSGDGVFLGQYQHSNIPNNNLFAYNDCSGSPHNAIEATFADGNIYRQNICNWSQYGLWLGYSYNSIIDSNQVLYNQHSGIAIDRGFNNQITYNRFIGNPIGIELWEGTPAASGYASQSSHDYQIEHNYFQGNTATINSSATENLLASNNMFNQNYDAFTISGNATGDSIHHNYFSKSYRYEIYNNSTNNLNAQQNTFVFNDTNYIKAKIYDKQDNPAKGDVLWHPFIGWTTPQYQTSPPPELSEPPSDWLSFPEVCQWLGITQDINVSWDSTEKKMGSASVHLSTGTGWYNSLSYNVASPVVPRWDLSNYGYLSFWIKSTNTNVGAFQYFHVRIGNNEGGYYKYTSTASALNQSLGVWKNYVVPFYGGSGWTRTQVGNISFSDINYVEVYTDSYGVGYDLWLDGVQFLLATDNTPLIPPNFFVQLYPNPADKQAILQIGMESAANIDIQLTDLQGRIIRKYNFFQQQPGVVEYPVNLTDIPQGVYFLTILSESCFQNKKLTIIH